MCKICKICKICSGCKVPVGQVALVTIQINISMAELAVSFNIDNNSFVPDPGLGNQASTMWQLGGNYCFCNEGSELGQL